ncbi:PorP/SprF family type IX secretion system membrane protein [Galbibacter orientalis]|uniref:PorP/SprF family type IX secretion system membrane protein n=1 Tax=Galbibacter orientalis TaxID=453852 RepID=UPI003080B6E8
MIKRYLLTIGLLLASYVLFSQVENTSAIVDWRQHNLTKYNKFLVNPTYSFVRNDTKAVSFWSRIQWTGIENSPQTYLLSYSGKVSENSGAGLGLYQQNLGLLVDSGLILNYAYGVKFTDNITLSVGMNTTLFRRGLNKGAISSTEPDPVVLENQDDFLMLVMPGINLSVNSFDIGIYAENIFDYNFNDSNTITDFSDKIFSGQLGYTKTFDDAVGFMEDAKWRNLVYGKTQPNDDFQFGFNSTIDLPYTGWFQAGYNTTFGISGGIGVKIGDGISIGVVYETGTSKTNNSFGGTYEAIASIELGPRKMRKNPAPSGGKAVTSKNINEEDYISSEEIKRRREEDANRIINDSVEEKVTETAKPSTDATSKYALYGGEATAKSTSGKSAKEKSTTSSVDKIENTGVKSAEKTEEAVGISASDKTLPKQENSNAKTEKPSAEIVVADKKSSEKIEKEVSTEKATVTGYAVYGGNQKDDLSGENSVEVARKQTEVTENETVKVYEADAEDYAKAAQEEFNSKINSKEEESKLAQTSEINNEISENVAVKQQTEAEKIEAEYQEFLRRSDSVANTIDTKSIDSTAITSEVFGKDVSYKTINSAPGIEKGFYLVVNVFSQEHYFNDFIEKLKTNGFEPKFFLNPENNYYYVYLYKANRYLTIKSLQRNNINGTYFEDKWVLWVK